MIYLLISSYSVYRGRFIYHDLFHSYMWSIYLFIYLFRLPAQYWLIYFKYLLFKFCSTNQFIYLAFVSVSTDSDVFANLLTWLTDLFVYLFILLSAGPLLNNLFNSSYLLTNLICLFADFRRLLINLLLNLFFIYCRICTVYQLNLFTAGVDLFC